MEVGDYLFIVVYYFVVDGVLWWILFEDFVLGYVQVEKEGSVVFL